MHTCPLNSAGAGLLGWFQQSALQQRHISLNIMQISGALLIFVATIATSLLALFGAPQVLERSLFRPYWLLRQREYHTVITSGLVHADLAHLLFNMVTFYFFAF